MGRLTQRITILGSTGSVGTQALDVIGRTGERFTVHALAARSDVEAIASQIEQWRPARVAMVDAQAATELRSRFPSVDVLGGEEALTELAIDPGADLVLNAVLGAAGLRATIASLEARHRVALANKESCIAGGPIVRRLLAQGAEIVPVDSEHAATHMCLAGEDVSSVTRLILTTSGGPFRGRKAGELRDVTVEDALAHPTWSMGAKITIDSATLMNKGLEVIEANVLFGLDFDRIGIVCQPQSVVHCLVGFPDGSWKASLAPPDMRVPIAYALGYPSRPDWGAEIVDWARMSALTFEEADTETFRCVPLAYEAGRTGGTAPAVLNAANEEAVGAFLDGDLSFLGIADVVERVVEDGAAADLGYGRDDVDLDDVLRADAWARTRARKAITE